MDPYDDDLSPVEAYLERDRRLWRVWLGIVTFLVLGALLWTGWLMFVWQPPATRLHHQFGSASAQRTSTPATAPAVSLPSLPKARRGRRPRRVRAPCG